MATRTVTTEKSVELAELVDLIKDYWKNQPNGLCISSKSDLIIDFRPIKNYLCTKHRVSAKDLEIYETHKLLLEQWAKSNPESFSWFMNYDGIEEPGVLHISISTFLVKPAKML